MRDFLLYTNTFISSIKKVVNKQLRMMLAKVYKKLENENVSIKKRKK